MSSVDPILYLDAQMDEVETHAFCAGTVAVFSRRSPDKEAENEDAAALIPFDADTGILVVADGAGGTRGGSQASSTAVYELCAALEHDATNERKLRDAILDGIESANREVQTLAIGAGTTLAIVEIGPGSIRPYHVGDSQILLMSGRGRQKLLTVSHSPVGFAEHSGFLAEDEALEHEDRHFVDNLIGAPDMTIELGARTEVSSKDTLVLASDGLYDNLAKDEIVEILRSGELRESTARLVERCAERMSRPNASSPSKLDDLTVLVYRPVAAQ